MPEGGWRYLIALGSNVRHPRFGAPERVLTAALVALAAESISVERAAPVIHTAAMGPSLRRFANSAAIVRTSLSPDTLLNVLKTLEARSGRKSGQRWGSRVLDCDIVLWSGGVWHSGARSSMRRARWLTVPHPAFRVRAFVLSPALAIAADWRDPLSGFTLRQLHARLTRRRPAPR